MDVASALLDKIRSLNVQLESLGKEPDDVPEFSVHSNALRRNAHLAEANRIRAQIIDLYSEYTTLLEDAVFTILEVQQGISRIVKNEMR